MSDNATGRASFRQFKAERADSVDSEDEEFDEKAYNALKNKKTTDHESAARQMFALDALTKKKVPKIKKSGTQLLPELLKRNVSVTKTVTRPRESFDEDSDAERPENAFGGSGKSEKQLRLKPTVKRKTNLEPRNRSGSYSWAETASRMRRSIRLKKGLHKDFLTVLEKENGKDIVRPQREKKAIVNPYNKNLKSHLKGIAARLTGENMLNANLMGTKGFWQLSQLVTDKNLELSKYFKIKTSKEIVAMISKIHEKLKAHGHLSSDSVLFNRSLQVNLMKPNTVNVKGKFEISKLQNDILQVGVVLVELFCQRRVGFDFCPSAFKAQHLEFTLGERNVFMFRSTRNMNRRKKPKNKKVKQTTFSDIEEEIRKEVSAALSAVEDLKGLDVVKNMILDCFKAEPDDRPFTLDMLEILQQTEEGFVVSSAIDKEEDLLGVLKRIMKSKRIGSSYLRGPRLVDIVQEKTEQEQKEEIKQIEQETMFSPKIDPSDRTKNRANSISEESHFINPEDISDMETVVSSEDPTPEEVEIKRETNVIKERLKARGSKSGTKKKKKGFNPLRAFLSHSKDMTKAEETELQNIDETRSNIETGKKKNKGSKAGKKKINLASFSAMDQSEDFEFEAQSVQANHQQPDVLAEVKSNYVVNKEDLQVFKAGFENVAKKKAKRIKKRFDPEKIAQKFQVQQRLAPETCEDVLNQSEKLLREEPNLLRLKAPVTIVGDIHGQFFDLRKLMQQCGQPGTEIGPEEKQTYLFLGDYVDRGDFSCEVLFYLLILKIKYNHNVYLLRGNHESKATSGYFGFKDECERKYGSKTYMRCCDVFQAMPIAAVVDTPGGKFFCLHGGISPNVRDLNQFVEFDRFKEPEMFGFLCDVLWADPLSIDETEDNTQADDNESDEDEDEEEQDNEEEQQKIDERRLKTLLGTYYGNPLRGCSFRFGLGALMTFLKNNNLTGIVRAHQVMHEGFNYHFQDLAYEHFYKDVCDISAVDKKPSDPEEVCPPVITVFSAANYCKKYGNKGAYLNIFRKPQGFEGNLKTAKFPAISLLDPVQYDAAYEPPLVEFPNEKQKTNLSLKETVPYMPLGYAELLEKAQSLQKVDIVKEIGESAQAILKKAIENKETPVYQTAQKVKPDLPPRRKKNSQSSSVSKKSSLRTRDGDQAPAKSWQNFRNRFERYKRNAKKQYQKAMQEDMINEIHPSKMSETAKKAKEILGEKPETELNLPSSISLLEDEEIDDGQKRHRASFQLSKLQENKSIKFHKKELIALQTLYLVIDSNQTGKITAKDLIAWAENSGGFLFQHDAEHTVSLLDFDKDGVIGFEDFLVFAAACKKIWTAQQYANIMTRGYKKQ